MDPRVEKIMTAAEYVASKLDGRKPYAGIVLGRLQKYGYVQYGWYKNLKKQYVIG